ncbi:MAG: polymer-forming cytoskeletal protein [Tannerellaceae bacterium]|nr:polymer-forming cytoskeletal protein [Tannerellaceae bacterium]
MAIKNREDLSTNGLHNTLSGGTTVQGDIVTEGDFRIDGKIEGNISCGAKIVIGPKAQVTGNISSVNVEVLGSVIGDIRTAGSLILKASASVKGDIVTQTLEIEPGAHFSGGCLMGADPEKL